MSDLSLPEASMNDTPYLSIDRSGDINEWGNSILNQFSRGVDLSETRWVPRDERDQASATRRAFTDPFSADGSRLQPRPVSARRSGNYTTFAELTGRDSVRALREDANFIEASTSDASRATTRPVRELNLRRTESIRRLSAHTRDLENMKFDVRELEYVNEIDSNLICPICQVPFIDPVVLECDHTYCKQCFDTWTNAGPNTDAMKCPSCRQHHFNIFKRASRLVVNMCDEVMVRCPSAGCVRTMARNAIRQHLQTNCEEVLVSCADSVCLGQLRRKVRDANDTSCMHTTHSECEICGWMFENEKLLNHKETCYVLPSKSHQDNTKVDQSCPGRLYGCNDDLRISDFSEHIEQCVFARLAPAMEAQSALIRSLNHQLSSLNSKNRALEESLEQLNRLVKSSLQPKIDLLAATQEADVEEIPREYANPTMYHSLVASNTIIQDLDYQHDHQQLLQLQDALQNRVSILEAGLTNIQQHTTEVAAQHSLALHNETLGIRQELAYTQGAAYRTQTAVQWLMNRERTANQRDAMVARGRQHSRQNTTTSAVIPSPTNAGSEPQNSGGGDRWANEDQTWLSSQRNSVEAESSTVNSTATSPIFDLSRPTLRRSSAGSSQERVKL